ncbi:MAG TPA: hypothetical protein VJO33_01010 [Gemmatimonadaceae bacterium]|nr:hypothetical protein [Gemmatimonadaceae bacterium]
MMAILGNHRRFSLLLTATLLAVVATAGWLRTRPEMSGDAAAHMRRAAAYYDSLVVLERPASNPAQITPATAIALGYLERLRLGLGSPFRLADFALADPRLDDSTRARVAWAILSRLRRGDAYVIDPVVADGFDEHTSGLAHVALIQHAIESARDPRAGELTVRVAYSLAAGEQTVSDQSDAVAAQIAALLRDRALAQADVRDLLRVADAQHLDPLAELVRRRRARSLVVEQPSAEPLDDQLQSDALAAVPRLLQSIRALSNSSRVADATSTANAPLLGAAAAWRLVVTGATQPPEPPVAVTVRTHRTQLLGGELPPELESARTQFVSSSLNAETLAGGYDMLLASGDTARAAGALAVLGAATSLRAMAQELPWFPGSQAPSVADLRAEFGLAGVSFDRDVRRDWQPYYLRMIGTSLRDLQRVLSGFSVAGLRIAVAAGGLPDTILALHDPATRTIRMSIFSSAGTLAHELAHDLDWQAARSLYAGSGYSTDRAVREQRGPLASSMRDLAAARVARRGAQPTEERPAEVFARSVDWLVAVSLAREGRSDGYLSAVQDAALTGYTTVSPVAMILGAARPLVDAVEEMTYLPESVRDGFLAQWADARTVDPYLLVRHVLSVQLPRRRITLSPSLFDDDPLRLTSKGPTVCADLGALGPELRARQSLLDMALDARALGLVRMRARWFALDGRPGWASSVLGVAPWSPALGDLAVKRVRAALVSQLDAARGGDQLRFALPSIFRPSASTCSLSER